MRPFFFTYTKFYIIKRVIISSSWQINQQSYQCWTKAKYFCLHTPAQFSNSAGKKIHSKHDQTCFPKRKREKQPKENSALKWGAPFFLILFLSLITLVWLDRSWVLLSSSFLSTFYIAGRFKAVQEVKMCVTKMLRSIPFQAWTNFGSVVCTALVDLGSNLNKVTDWARHPHKHNWPCLRKKRSDRIPSHCLDDMWSPRLVWTSARFKRDQVRGINHTALHMLYSSVHEPNTSRW